MCVEIDCETVKGETVNCKAEAVNCKGENPSKLRKEEKEEEKKFNFSFLLILSLSLLCLQINCVSTVKGETDSERSGEKKLENC